MCMSLALAVACTSAFPLLARAELAAEELGRSLSVGPPGDHWSYYLDFELGTFNGRYVLMDADTTDYLAHVSAGQMPTLDIAPDGKEIYVTSTSYEYLVDGDRHDFVTIFDTTDYASQGRIELPSGKRALMASLRRSTLLRDSRFLVVYNYTPATSLSVVDLERREHVMDVDTPGCHLVYPTGERGVSMLCGDGSLQTYHFGEAGKLRAQERSKPFFDPQVDHLKTNAAAIGDTWYFVSYSGDVYPVDLSGESPRFESPWALVDHDKKPANIIQALFTMGKAGPWLPGGMQLAATHEARGELYVIMHPIFWSESKGDHDFPGPEVWVYDIRSKERVRRIKSRGVVMSINVTPDDAPVLTAFGADIKTEATRLEVYDAISGKFLREMVEYGQAALEFEPVAQPGNALSLVDATKENAQ
jgi:methylamine dehydrogenase heavy chain